MPRLVIGLTGPIGSGKTTVARELERYGFTRMRFAGPLKKMMVALGLSLDQVDGASKETPSELLCGRTPRHAMQTIGTEWGRMCIGEDIWVNAWKHSVSKLPADVLVVVDDLRFENEANAIRALGGSIVRVKRGAITQASNTLPGHASEVFDFDPDTVLDNNGTIERLREQIRFMVVGLAQGLDIEREQGNTQQKEAA